MSGQETTDVFSLTDDCTMAEGINMVLMNKVTNTQWSSYKVDGVMGFAPKREIRTDN